jgi:hypothetical protein
MHTETKGQTMATLRTALLLAAAALLACCGSAFVVPSTAKASPAALDRRCITTGWCVRWMDG